MKDSTFEKYKLVIDEYYVYEILNKNVVEYVGKGCGDRVLSHFRGEPKSNIAKRISNNRFDYSYRIVYASKSESSCLTYEMELIKDYKNRGFELVNVMGNSNKYKSMFDNVCCMIDSMNGKTYIRCGSFGWHTVYYSLLECLDKLKKIYPKEHTKYEVSVKSFMVKGDKRIFDKVILNKIEKYAI